MRQSRKRNALFLAALMMAGMAALAIWQTKAQTVVSAGYDQFSTPNNAVSQESLTLPAGQLLNSNNSPSLAFSGTVVYEGGPVVPGYNGDTVIERTASVSVPGSTPLVVIGLNLASVTPIPVSFADGSLVYYAVAVSQSPSTSSTGTMNFAVGGTYTNSININRQYTFTAAGQPIGTLDCGASGWPPIALTSSGTWEVTGNGASARFAAAVAGSSVTIHPNTEQSILASHGIGPAPSPTPTCAPATDESRSEDAVTRPNPCLQQQQLIKKELEKRKP
jgi:hypothetical protein